jgi:hypothetical protein
MQEPRDGFDGWLYLKKCFPSKFEHVNLLIKNPHECTTLHTIFGYTSLKSNRRRYG